MLPGGKSADANAVETNEMLDREVRNVSKCQHCPKLPLQNVKQRERFHKTRKLFHSNILCFNGTDDTATLFARKGNWHGLCFTFFSSTEPHSDAGDKVSETHRN